MLVGLLDKLQYRIEVNSNDIKCKPHFHLIRGRNDYEIRLDSSYYLLPTCKKKINPVLLEVLVEFLSDKSMIPGLTNYQFMVSYWNKGNSIQVGDYNPDYMDLIRYNSIYPLGYLKIDSFFNLDVFVSTKEQTRVPHVHVIDTLTNKEVAVRLDKSAYYKHDTAIYEFDSLAKARFVEFISKRSNFNKCWFGWCSESADYYVNDMFNYDSVSVNYELL